MAILQDIIVQLQIQDHDGSWINIPEFDTAYTIKEESNSKNHWKTNVLAWSGKFRLLVSVTKVFRWYGCHALLLTLTCQEGFWINEYPIVALKVANSTIQNNYATVGCMAEDPITKRLEYILESVYLPIDPCSPHSSGYTRTLFSFKEVKESFVDRSLPKGWPSPRKHSIRLDISRCKVVQKSYKKISLKTLPNTNARDLLRRALFPDINLETEGLQPNPHERLASLGGPEYRVEYDKTTFMFVYHSKRPSDALDAREVDVIDKTLSPRRSTVAMDPIFKQSDLSTALLSNTSQVSPTNTTKVEDDDPFTIVEPQSQAVLQQADILEGTDSDSDTKSVCTPPLNPTTIMKFPKTDRIPVPRLTSDIDTTESKSGSRQQWEDIDAAREEELAELRRKMTRLQDEKGAEIIAKQNTISCIERHKMEAIDLNKKMAELDAAMESLQLDVEVRDDSIRGLTEAQCSLDQAIAQKEAESANDKRMLEALKASERLATNRLKELQKRYPKRSRSQASLDASPAYRRRTRERTSSAMQTDSD